MSEWIESEYEQAYEHAEGIIKCAFMDAVDNDEPLDVAEIQRGIDLLWQLAGRLVT